MIQRGFLSDWRAVVPWVDDAQIEQDLVLARCLVELYSDPLLREQLAFRGGTALNKLHLQPAARYSEDLDFVQVKAGPIGPVLNAARARLDPWLGKPEWKKGDGRVTVTYRFETELPPVRRNRVKIEINTREHFAVLGFAKKPFKVESRWFSGQAEVLTYEVDELLGTKLRALYQRKKGRDLYDLFVAFERKIANPSAIVECFLRYMKHGNHRVSRAQFESNLHAKVRDPAFTDDIKPLLGPDVGYSSEHAAELISERLIAALKGDPWAGRPR